MGTLRVNFQARRARKSLCREPYRFVALEMSECVG
jgi:hypothetical protein